MTGCLQAIARALLRCLPSKDSDELYKNASAAYAEYFLSNNPKDLKTALQNYKSALSARINENHPDLADTYVNYAAALWTQYERSGQPADDLTKIIKLDEQALVLWDGASPKPKGYPVLLLNLATAHLNQYRATSDTDSFTRSIKLYDELRQYPSDARRKGLMMLGTALSRKCDIDETTDRLDEAIDYLEEALSLSKPSQAPVTDEKGGEKETDIAMIRIGCLYNLATSYDVRDQLSKHQHQGQPAQLNKPHGQTDLDKAIKYNYAVRKLLDDDHPDHAPCLYNLARQLFTRYERAQKEKSGPVLLDVHLDPKKGVQDLRDAKRIAEEAQRLLADRDASPELKEGVDRLLDVVQQHSASVSKNASKENLPLT